MNAVSRSLKHLVTASLLGLGLLVSTQAQALTVISFGNSGDAMKRLITTLS